MAEPLVLMLYPSSLSDVESLSGVTRSQPPQTIARGDLTECSIWSRHCAAAVISAIMSKTLTAPLDRVKVHMQVKISDAFDHVL